MADHVLHILGTAQPDSTGMAYIVRALAQGLDPARYTVHALFLGQPGPLIDQLREAGASAAALDLRQGIRTPLDVLKFWSFLRQRRYSIVHVHYGGRAVVKVARVATGARVVRHLHGRIVEGKGLTPMSFSASGVDAIVAVSQAVAKCVVEGQVHVIYAGLSLSSAEPPGQKNGREIIIGTAGRLVELKGIDYLIKAATQLLPEFPSLRIEIAGSGPMRPTLEAQVQQAGLEKSVTFLGWIGNVQSVLSRWDIFAMPSLEEGFPIAALDAMAAGLPVVASSVGGVPELIQDGITGWLVPLRDVEALVTRLRQLLSDPDQRIQMGTAGYIRIREQFNTTRMIKSFAGLYDELLGGRSA